MAPGGKWGGVPSDKRKAWGQAFAADLSQARLGAPCPVCGTASLRRYYGKPRNAPRTLEGTAFQGPGALWEWCIKCRIYEHASCLVPEQWDPPPLQISERTLRAHPTCLAEALEVFLQGAHDPS